MVHNLNHDCQHAHDHEARRSIVARFTSRVEAREAIRALHRAHYLRVWLGMTHVAVTGGPGDRAPVEPGSGFFSETESLVDALVSHGVPRDSARELERALDPGDALVIVDANDRDLLEVISLLEQRGGRIAVHEVESDIDLSLPPSAPGKPTTDSIDPAFCYGAEDEFFRRSEVSR